MQTETAEKPRARRQATDAGGALLEERFSYLFHRISARIALIGNRHFRQLELNHYSARILVLLLEHAELRTGELVELMQLPQSTISTQLRALERRKLVRRERSSRDNRAVEVTLTALGHRVASDCQELSRRVQELLVEELSPAEIDAAYAFLRKAEARLASLQDRTLHGFGAG